MELYTLLRRAVKRGVLLKTRRVIDLNFNQKSIAINRQEAGCWGRRSARRFGSLVSLFNPRNASSVLFLYRGGIW